MLFRFREVDVCFGAFVFRSGPGLFGMAGWGKEWNGGADERALFFLSDGVTSHTIGGAKSTK